MWFIKKSELLRYVGRHEKDTKWVDRGLAKGIIVQREGLYSLTSEYVKELEDMVTGKPVVEKAEPVSDGIDWKGKYEKLKEEWEQWLDSPEENTAEITTTSEGDSEAEVQWHYYEDLYHKEVEDKQNRIRKAFNWIKMIKPAAKWEEFRDWVLSDEE